MLIAAGIDFHVIMAVNLWPALENNNNKINALKRYQKYWNLHLELPLSKQLCAN